MIDVMHAAAFEAGEIMIPLFQKGVKANQKTSHHDLVTEADIKAQGKIVDVITKKLVKKGIIMTDIGFVGEENLHSPAKYTFVIDPVDGTNNFASGIPFFCVSIALFINNVLSKGIIYNPITKVFFEAEKGKGTVKLSGKDKTKLKMIPLSLHNSVMGTHSYSIRENQSFIHKSIERMSEHARAVRIFGSCTIDMCFVADNSVQIIAYEKTKIWDVAAGALIIQEAGGAITDWKGKNLTYDLAHPTKYVPFIATHPKSLSKVLEYF